MNFYEEQKREQIKWWKDYSNQPEWDDEEKSKDKWGIYKGKPYPQIIKEDWKRLLWEGIQIQINEYLIKNNNIQKHSGVKNLLSSWNVCANLYFPANFDNRFKDALLCFLKSKLNKDIISLEKVELEFGLKGELSPAILLGEQGGNNGSGQTSPDVAFTVRTKTGTGLILTECKYTEHSFYRCSARRIKDRGDKPGNPHPEKCLLPASNNDYKNIPCHQHVWERKYFDYFQISERGETTIKKLSCSNIWLSTNETTSISKWNL